MEKSMRIHIPALVLAVVLGNSALAKPPLRDVPEIDDGVMVIAIADAIRKTCDDINPRLIRAYTTLSALKSLAREMGYTDEEVEKYVTSKSEKERMRAKAESFLEANGVRPNDDAALCRFGKRQIQSQTDIGKLLK